MDYDVVKYPMYKDVIWKTFRDEYQSRFKSSGGVVLKLTDWINFLKDKDIGLEYEDTVADDVDSVTTYNRIYKIVDRKKWLLSCIKYGLTL